MILDLKAFVDETLDINMADGMVLRIPKPSQLMLIKIMAFQDIDADTPDEKVEEALNSMVSDILNSNINKIIISEESIAAMNSRAKLEILISYTDFMRKVQTNPITPCPQSRVRQGLKTKIRNFFRGSGK